MCATPFYQPGKVVGKAAAGDGDRAKDALGVDRPAKGNATDAGGVHVGVAGLGEQGDEEWKGVAA